MKLLTTNEAAERLGVHVTRVRALIVAERLPAQKIGRDYMIRETDLRLVADRSPGRPPNATTATRGNEASTSKKKGKK
jgi:excisionase family DNA binding protein